jgi:hypothetical protein
MSPSGRAGAPAERNFRPLFSSTTIFLAQPAVCTIRQPAPVQA